jgi:hypothetical protein
MHTIPEDPQAPVDSEEEEEDEVMEVPRDEGEQQRVLESSEEARREDAAMRA